MRRAWMLSALVMLLIAAVWGWQRLAPDAPAESRRAPTDPAPPAAPAPLPAATPRAAPPVDPRPSGVLPQRAPPSVQIDDQQRLQTDPDLPRLAAELTQRAERGDADAADALHQLLKQCSVRAELESGAIPADLVWEVIAEGVGAERIPALQAEYAQLVQRCGALADLDAAAMADRIRGWARRAAELGQPRARLRVAPDEDARRAAAAELLHADPATMVSESAALGTLTGYGRYGWIMAACLLDPACAADPLASAERSVGFAASVGEGSYAELLNLSPRQWQIARAQAEEIVALYQARRFDLLLAAPVRR